MHAYIRKKFVKVKVICNFQNKISDVRNQNICHSIQMKVIMMFFNVICWVILRNFALANWKWNYCSLSWRLRVCNIEVVLKNEKETPLPLGFFGFVLRHATKWNLHSQLLTGVFGHCPHTLPCSPWPQSSRTGLCLGKFFKWKIPSVS